MAAALLVAFLVLAVVDWIAVGVEARALEYVAKPGALLALLLYVAASGGASAWLVAALACSLLGDILLMLPADRFASGLATFLVAHLAYIGAFRASAGSRLAWLAAVVVVSLPLARRIVGAIPRAPLRAAVVTYMLVLASMVASALASGRPAAALGAILFLASDSLIAWSRFVAPLPWAQPAIMITYHLGQLGLVRGLVAT
jgi:uncharacterized membrane protein YhhN